MVLLPCCSSSDSNTANYSSRSSGGFGPTASLSPQFVPLTATKSAATLYREAGVIQDYIPRGRHARKYRRSMTPRYITIHSTQNFSRGADALRHSEALKNGKLRARKLRGYNRIGYLVWHFTVDEDRAVQHLPTNEQGEHADFSGPGNRYSIGIEMCENKGNSRSATLERTAKLTAYLMQKHNISLRNVVPHYHWPRRGVSQPHKNCPHYLLDNGRPGGKWQWFLAKVNKHYLAIGGANPMPSGPSINRHGQIVEAQAAPVPVTKKTYSAPSYRYHTVKKGDTLSGLSRKYDVSVSSIQRVNSMSSTVIVLGKKLRIPTS